MKQLTLKTALYHMARMWGDLAKTGAKNKPVIGINCNCYLCEYFCTGYRAENKKRKGGCRKCTQIMKKIWPDGCQNFVSSIFVQWGMAETTKERKDYARQIADEAWAQWRLCK